MRICSSLIALRRIFRATEVFGRELAQSAGLTAVQFRVLQVVAETEQTTAKAISTRLRVSQVTTTLLVDRLVSRGMVVREKSLPDTYVNWAPDSAPEMIADIVANFVSVSD